MRQYGGSQTVLVTNQLLLGDNSEGRGLELGANDGLIQLPPGARVSSVKLAIDTAFDASSTIAISSATGSVTLAPTAADAVDVTAGTVDEALLPEGDMITITTSGAMTTGEGRVMVEYIVNGRQNENQ